MASVQDLYLVAESMRARGRPPREIRQYLVTRAREEGLGAIEEVRKGDRFEVRIGQDGKIIFDGTKFFYQGASGDV
jgi:hypothetical protein